MINVKEAQALVDQAQKSAEVAYVNRVLESLN